MATGQDVDVYHDVDEDIIKRANTLLATFENSSLTVNSVDDISVEHFVLLYEATTGDYIPGSDSMRNDRDRANICQYIIQSLSEDVFGTSLDHISGIGIVAGNRRNIADLLEIFTGLSELKSETDRDDDNLSYTDIIKRANKLLATFENSSLKVNSVDDISVEHFVLLYEATTGDYIPGSDSMRNDRDRANICHYIIQSLSEDVFGTCLDHISGIGIVAGNRRNIADLLEIFTGLSELKSETDEDDDNPSYTGTKTQCNTDDEELTMGHLSAPLREILDTLNRETNIISEKSTTKRKPLSVINKAKEVYTQTTPVMKVTSQTSPINWADLLRKTRINRVEKSVQGLKSFTQSMPAALKKERIIGKQKPLSNKFIEDEPTVFSKSTRTRSEIRNPSTTRFNVSAKSMKKVSKPKPVICSKLRRKSSSGSSTHFGRRQQSVSSSAPLDYAKGNDYTNHMLKLLDDEESIRSRRREINQQIHQLQEEGKTLKSLHDIIIKEIRLTQTMGTRRRLNVPFR